MSIQKICTSQYIKRHTVILGPTFFLIYINDLPKLATIGTKILLYADDTRIIVTSSNLENFETQINKIFGDINNWFKINQLILNYNRTYYLQFNTKNSKDHDLKLNYQGNYVEISTNTKFLGLIIDDRGRLILTKLCPNCKQHAL